MALPDKDILQNSSNTSFDPTKEDFVIPKVNLPQPTVDFGGTTKKGRPNIRTLSMADHGQLMEKRTSKAEAATEAETVKQNTETFDTRVAARKARKANGEE